MRHLSVTIYITFSLLSSSLFSAMPPGGVLDVGVKYFLSPVEGDAGELVPIIVSIHNYGDLPATDFYVCFVAEGGAIMTEFVEGPVMAGDTMVFEFPWLFDVPIGNFFMCSWTELEGDINSFNDSTCSAGEFLLPPLVDLAADTSGCEGLLLDAGNPGMIYLWNTGETTQTKTVNTSGTYWVTVINAVDEFSTDTTTVEIIEKPAAEFIYMDMPDTSVSFTNLSVNAETYLWDFGDGTTSTEVNPTHHYLMEGTFEISLSAFNFCGEHQIIHVIEMALSSEDLIITHPVTVFPNPARDELTIQATGDVESEYVIYNALGQMMINGKITEMEARLNLSGFVSGIYYLDVINDHSSSKSSIVFAITK